MGWGACAVSDASHVVGFCCRLACRDGGMGTEAYDWWSVAYHLRPSFGSACQLGVAAVARRWNPVGGSVSALCYTPGDIPRCRPLEPGIEIGQEPLAVVVDGNAYDSLHVYTRFRRVGGIGRSHCLYRRGHREQCGQTSGNVGRQ